MIYHVLTALQWEAAKSSGEVLAWPGEEGFVHSCDRGHIPGVVERFSFGGSVVVVGIDPTRLGAETR